MKKGGKRVEVPVEKIPTFFGGRSVGKGKIYRIIYTHICITFEAITRPEKQVQKQTADKNFFWIISGGFLLVLLAWYGGALQGLLSYDHLNRQPAEYHFTPFISVWVAKGLASLPSFLRLLLTMVAVPYAAYLLLVNIFNRHLSINWAVFMALLSVSVFPGFPFRQFLMNLVGLAGQSPNEYFMLITGFPLPGLSTVLFLLIYKLNLIKTQQLLPITITLLNPTKKDIYTGYIWQKEKLHVKNE